MASALDNIDRGILHMLRVDARDTPAQEIAEKTGVSASTVRNRIAGMEANGVIVGYPLEIDYEAADLPLRVIFVITASPTERSHYVENLLDIKGVVYVRETLTGRRNIHVEEVGTSTSDNTRMTDAIHELGLEIGSSEIMKRREQQPFSHFQYEGELVGEDMDEDA